MSKKFPHFPGFRTKLDTPGPRPSWSNKIFYISIRMNTAEQLHANIDCWNIILRMKAEIQEAEYWHREGERCFLESNRAEAEYWNRVEEREIDEERERFGELYVLHLKEHGMTDSDEIARNLAEYMIYLTKPSSYQEGDMDEDDGDDEGDILRPPGK